MKIKQNKQDNINENSKNALKDFSKKQIIMNILYHKIFLGMCILVNIGLFIFVILYQKQLKEIHFITNKNTREYRKNNFDLTEQRNSIDHKLVNIIAVNRRRYLQFAYSFENKNEFNMIKSMISEYYRSNPLQYDENIFEQYKLNLIYQSTSLTSNFDDLKDILNYHRNSLFIIHTVRGKKFGIYVDEPIIFNYDKEYISNENKLFIISFEAKSIHKYNGNGTALKINKKKFIEIGDGEIIIFENFYNNGGFIDYPLKSFEGLNEYDNIFTFENGKFDIKFIEIFAFYLDEKKFFNK